MSENEYFLSDSDDDKEYNVLEDYRLKKREREDISSSEDEAFREMAIVMKKKRARIPPYSIQPGPSRDAVSHINGNYFLLRSVNDLQNTD